MKFMCSWKVASKDWIAVTDAFRGLTATQRADVGPDVKLIGRWHDMCARTGVLILESDSATGVQKYLHQWNSMMDVSVVPVLDDEESAQALNEIAMARG